MIDAHDECMVFCHGTHMLLWQGLEVEDEEDIYVVEKILKERKVGRVTEYFIKWKGHAASTNTWEPYAHIKGRADEALQKFKKGKSWGKATSKIGKKKKKKLS
jgi:hypothetical protein